jgi:hypothetical protein
MLMNEYRLALEFWGSVFGLTLLAPLLAGTAIHLRQLFQNVRRDVSAPLSSVPSNPHPSWPGC